MFGLQQHNQVLFHLSQLTSARSSKRSHLSKKSCQKLENNLSSVFEADSFEKALSAVRESGLIESLPRQYQPKKWIFGERVTLLTRGGTRYRAEFLGNSTDKNFLPGISQALDIQVRCFKTERAKGSDTSRNPGLFQRLRLAVGFERPSPASPKTLRQEQPLTEQEAADPAFLKNLVNSQSGSMEEKVKLAFAEGYMSGQSQGGRSGGRKWLKVAQQLLTIVLAISIFISLMASANGSMFRIQLGNQVEVDPEEINVTFNDVKGADEAKQELKDVVEFLKNPEKFSVLGGKLPKGVLLVGPPGTGKTLLARAVAGEAGVPFFHAAGPEFDEILVGQGARRVRDLFKAAKDRAPCVIFIDEIDSVGAKRTNSVLHPYANQTINQLLSEMDGFHQNDGVIVLGATNRRDDLDKALLRPGRFDVEVNVPTPDLTGRKEILSLYLSRVLTKSIDVELLARGTTGFTGADLENMVNQAALKAALDGADSVTMKYLESARDKVLMGPERKSRIPDEETNEITAYHEGGHTLVAFYTKGSPPLHKVTIIPRGPTLGHTAYMPEKESYHVTKKQLLAMMDTMMGGRAAEELVFGAEKITSGAANDLKQATNIAIAMVREWGMSDSLGLRTYDNNNKSFININELSPHTTELIDMEVKKILQDSYERAKAILKTHSKEHKLLAEALLKYETLDKEDINSILSGGGTDGRKRKRAAEAHRKICGVYGDDSITECTAQKWFAKLRSEDTSLDDSPRSGRPTEVDSSDIKALIEQNRSLPEREIAETLGIGLRTVHRHLKQLGYESRLDTWVPTGISQCVAPKLADRCGVNHPD